MKHFIYTGEEGLEYILPGQVPILLINDNVKFHVLINLHRESKKTRHQTLAHNFTKYWPIFKILSLLDSVGNLQQNHIQIPHHTLNVSLHYNNNNNNDRLTAFDPGQPG